MNELKNLIGDGEKIQRLTKYKVATIPRAEEKAWKGSIPTVQTRGTERN